MVKPTALAAAVPILALVLAACSTQPATTGTQANTATASSGSPGASASLPVGGEGLELVATYDAGDIEGLDVIGYIEAAPDNYLYVVSAASSEVIVLDGKGQVVRRWGEPGTELGQFDFQRDPADPANSVGGVAVTENGTVYVVESGNKRVQRFNADGAADLVWGQRGTEDGEFLDPIGITVAPSGEVYVVDDERDDIQVFTRDGGYLKTIGRHGRRLGEMSFTGNIRFHHGAIVNADFGNSRVQVWHKQDGWISGFGEEGTDPGQFVEPQDVAFGPDGTMYVVDDSRVQAFAPEGTYLGAWPAAPSPEHLATIAYLNGSLWVGAPYIDTLYQVSALTW